MSEDPNSKTYRAKRVPESGATLGQSNPVQADYQLLAQILQISEQDAIKILQARTLPAPGAPLHLPSFGPEVEKLITEVVENPLVSAAARAGQPINPIDRSLSPEVPPPALVPTKNWYSALSDEAKAQADRVMGFMNWGLNQVQEAVDTGVGVGVSYVGLPTGEQMQVPWPINGSFGRFAINPLTQSDEGALLIDTPPGVTLDVNIAGSSGPIDVNITGSSGPIEVDIQGTPAVTIDGTPNVNIASQTGNLNVNLAAQSGNVNVAIQGTPTVTISGTPTITISGTPTVTISGTPNINITNASIDVNNTVASNGQETVTAASSSSQSSTGGTNINMYTVPPGKLLVLRSIVAQVRAPPLLPGVAWNYFQVQIFRGGSGNVASTFESVFNDATSHSALGANSLYAYIASVPAVSSDPFTMDGGGSGASITGVMSVSMANVITLDPGDSFNAYIYVTANPNQSYIIDLFPIGELIPL